MPQIELLADLCTMARQRANQEKSKLVGDTELTTIMQREVASTYNWMIQVGADDQFVTKADLSVTPGSAGALLPADFFQLKAAMYQGGGEWLPFDHFEWQETPALMSAGAAGGTPWGQCYRYRIIGNQSDGTNPPSQSMAILPPVSSTLAVRVFYLPIITFTEDVGHAGQVKLDGINYWLEDSVVGAAIVLLAKEESDTSEHRARRNEIRATIQALASGRDRYQQDGVSDTRAADGDGLYGSRRRWP